MMRAIARLLGSHDPDAIARRREWLSSGVRPSSPSFPARRILQSSVWCDGEYISQSSEATRVNRKSPWVVDLSEWDLPRKDRRVHQVSGAPKNLMREVHRMFKPSSHCSECGKLSSESSLPTSLKTEVRRDLLKLYLIGGSCDATSSSRGILRIPGDESEEVLLSDIGWELQWRIHKLATADDQSRAISSLREQRAIHQRGYAYGHRNSGFVPSEHAVNREIYKHYFDLRWPDAERDQYYWELTCRIDERSGLFWTFDEVMAFIPANRIYPLTHVPQLPPAPGAFD